ncbi:DNA sulfur modification protein DndB [Bacillus sp. FSL W7-1034]|uniref:DNA sulfur modification protein DndB n=1 Tax=Bacillus sp. FSL W7-1034 TaxID=2954564 RepID=UPI003159DD74
MDSLKNIMISPHYLSFNAMKGKQFNQHVISIQCSVDQVLKFIEIDREVQRDIIEYHVTDIQKYIQYGLDGNDIYFPPLIFSSRGKGNYDKNDYKFKLNFDDKLIVLDGQHRIKAFEMIIARLETRNDLLSKDKLSKARNFPLTIQIFTDLTISQEQQLFTDINTKSSKVSNTLLVMYKNNSLCGELTKDIIYNHPTISMDKFEVRGKTTRTKLMTAATLHNTIITLNDGILYTAKTKSKISKDNYEQYKNKTEDFLNLLVKYAPENAHNRNECVMFIPVVIFGIALFLYEAQEKNQNFSMRFLFINVISKVDWSHKNVDFKLLGIPYKQTTKKYNFSSGARGSRMITSYLNRILEEKISNV